MRLNAAQKEKVEDQLGFEALPEDHPVAPDLMKAFGDHTFFLDAEGLNIVETDDESDGTNGNVVKLASWSEDRTKLRGHQPEVRPVTVELEPDKGEPAA
jgi:hypothetical protein